MTYKLYTLDNQFIEETDDCPDDFTGIVKNSDGSKYWYLKGYLHKLDGPAIEYADGSKDWWVNGEYHRLDGPACEDADGVKVWFVRGKLHRLDGPAWEYPDGSKEWYVDGKEVTKEQHNLLHSIMNLKGLL